MMFSPLEKKSFSFGIAGKVDIQATASLALDQTHVKIPFLDLNHLLIHVNKYILVY